MNLKERKEFLREVNIGDYVTIYYKNWFNKEYKVEGPLCDLNAIDIGIAKPTLDVFTNSTQFIWQAKQIKFKYIIKYEKSDKPSQSVTD